MSLLPQNNPLNADELTEQAKQIASQQAETALIKKVAGGAKAEQLQQGTQIARQVYTASGGRPGASITPPSGFAGPLTSPDGADAQQVVSSSPSAPLTTTAQIAASLQPVWVGCEVNIDGLLVSPVLSLQISQTHGEHNQVEIHFPQRILGEAAFTMDQSQSLLGKVAEVTIKNRNSADGSKLENNFVITSVVLDQNNLNDGILVVSGYSPTILLDGAPHYESFHKKTLKDIATIVGKPLQQAKGSINPDPTLTDILTYTSRYNENAWNFLKRLSAETGQWLYYNGSALVFGKPEKGEALKLIYGSNCYHLRQQLRVSPLQTGLFDYNATTHVPLSSEAGSYADNAGSYAEKAFAKSRELYSATTYATPAFLNAEKPLVEAVGKARSGGRASGMYVMKGESTIYELRVGALVDVSFKRLGESSEHSQMRILSVVHSLDASGDYTNTFEAIPATAEMPPPPEYSKPVTYPMLGVVLSNKDPEGQGRVQVQFMGWQQDHSAQQTDWIRVLTPDAGGTEAVMQNRGQLFIPEVGDQVLVDFIEGNPDRPYVAGSMYHGSNANTQGGRDNTLKSITTRSGHRMDFDDSKGGTSITITDKSGNTIYFDTQGSNITITAPETMTLNAKNIFVNAQENITTSAGANMSDFAGGHISIDARLTIRENAGKDYMLNAENITKTAIKNITSSSDTHTQHAKEDVIANSLEGSIYHHAKKEVVSNSGQNTKLF